jgi:TonB family protein
MAKQKEVKAVDPSDALVCILNETNGALNDKKHVSINRMETIVDSGFVVSAIVALTSALIYGISHLETSQEAEPWALFAVCAGVCFMILAKVNKLKMVEGEKMRLLKVAVKKIRALEMAQKNDVNAVEELTNHIHNLKIVLRHKIKELQANLGISINCDLGTNAGFDAAIYTLSEANNALKCKTFTEKETNNTLSARIIREIESFFIGIFQMMFGLAGFAIIYILILIACLSLTSWLGLAENLRVLMLSMLICFAAVFAVAVIVVLPKVNKPRMSVQEKTRILETAVENNHAIEKALEDEINATKERADYLRSLNILLQQKIGKLQAQLREYSYSANAVHKDKIFLSQKTIMFLITIIIPVVTALAQTPDIKWYTKNPKAKSFQISTADELAGLARLVNNEAGLKQPIDFSGKTISLVQNINLSKYGSNFNGGKGWNPIGNVSEDGAVFKGVFDGNGKIITGLYIRGDDKLGQVGLFGAIEGTLTGLDEAEGFGFYKGDAKVINLGLVDVNIIGSDWAGGIAGAMIGSQIVNCYTTGKVSGNDAVGGIVGNTFGSQCIVSKSYSAATVNGNENVGGVVGYVKGYSGISNCYSLGPVNGDKYVGGIAGRVGSHTDGVSNCYSVSAISGKEHVGGIMGGIDYIMTALSNNTALNPSVKSTGSSVGRIAGTLADVWVLSDNTAFNGITNNVGNTLWDNRTAKSKNGEDISTSVITSDGTLGGRFTSKNGWTVQKGKLPGFGTAVDMPEYLKSDGAPDQNERNKQNVSASTDDDGVGRKGVAGIGYGYGSGFGGSGGGIDDLLSGRMGGEPKATSPGYATLDAGARSRASVQRVVMQNIAELRYSYNRRVRENPGLQGTITIRFAIDEFGKVISARLVGSTMNDPELENTVLTKVKSWIFEKIDKPGDVTEVTYPFAFSQ